MKKIKTIENAIRAYNKYVDLKFVVWKYIDGFYQQHKDDSIGVEFDKYDRLFQRGIATYDEMIRLKLDIIEAYNNIH